MRYRATIYPLYEGHRQPSKRMTEYRHAASLEHAGRFFRRAFPYPEYVVEDVMEDPISETEKRLRDIGEQVPNKEFQETLESELKKAGFIDEPKSNPGNPDLQSNEVYQSLLKSIKEETEAVEAYDERGEIARKYNKDDITELFKHIRDEEQQHFKEFQRAATNMYLESEGIEKVESQNPGNPGPDILKELNIKQIQLKTDTEKVAPELEASYRASIDNSRFMMSYCGFSSAIANYLSAHHFGEMIIDRVPSTLDKVDIINELALQALEELAVENCSCKFIKEESIEH